MAATGFTPISLYYSTTASAVPLAANLANGELALNTADMKLYSKNSSGVVTLLASSGGATGTVSSVAVSGGTTGLTTSGGPITTSGTITLAGTLAIANGGTGATTAPNARTNLGATTVGGNFFTLTNPTAITFPRINADNTVSALDAATFRTAIGAGTGSGTVTGVTATSPVASSGGTAPVISLSTGYGDTLNPYASKTANFFLAAPNGAAGVPSFRAVVAADIPTLNQSTTGNAATATVLQTARTINGVSFNGSANITVAATTTNTLTLGTYLTGTSFNGSAAVTAAVDATSANTASKVVARDASGNFSAGTITATLSGNATSATSATTATNIAGGAAGRIPYNTGSGATSFVAVGTSGQVLQSNGTSAPTWVTAASGAQAFVAFGSTGGF